jgi:hypothetical protein
MYDPRKLIPVPALLLAMLPAGQALAHTPYILPNSFDVQGARVTLIGAMTEDDYFIPDGALAVPAYLETLPDGQGTEVKPAATLKDLTVTEAAITAPGTYRFSTGQYVMRTTTFVNLDGKWLSVRSPRGRPPGEGASPAPPQSEAGARPANPPQEGMGAPGGGPPGGGGGPPNSIAQADVPAGAPSMQVESVSVVETYVTKGAPTDAALKTAGQGLELKPVTHPNAVYVDQGFAFQLLVDGKPLAAAPISVYRAGNIYDDRRIAVETRTDANGMGKVAFNQPGIYLLTTHAPGGAPKPGEPPPARNYTYSLTFEVTR